MTKAGVITQICNFSVDFETACSLLNINDYVNLSLPSSSPTVYGVNVRLKGDAGLMPFIETNKNGFNAQGIASKVDKEHTIPKLNEKFGLSEICFTCRLNSTYKVSSISLSKVRDVTGTIVNSTGPTITGATRSFTLEDLKDWLNEDKSFLLENIAGLGYTNNDDITVWITGEDLDSTSKGESFLSNAMAISSDAEFIESVQKKHEDLVEFLFLLKNRFLVEVDAQRKRAAEKSAKAAIMSRNMSHNLGSHVMAYLKQKLGSVTSILNSESKVLYSLISEKGLANAPKDVEMPFLVGLGRFIGYLQERQDYIATIATDYIPYGAPVNFKDAIYDELNPDLRYIRHKEDGKNRPYNILLNYIAKSEGLSRENMELSGSNKFHSKHDILFGFVDYNDSGEPLEFGIIPSNCESDYPAMKKMRETNLSLPGGLVGRQALFSIIENLVRNAAKHGDLRSVKDGNLCFTFDVLDGSHLSDNDSRVEPVLDKRIVDNTWRTLYRKASDIDKLLLLTITDNLSYDNNQNLAARLRDGIVENYIDEVSGIMTDSNKGIKEIRISAAWLREETDEKKFFRYNDSPDENKLAPLVAIEMTEDGHLRYIIALKKNKHAAILTNKKYPTPDNIIFRALHQLLPQEWDCYDCVTEFIKNGLESYSFIIVPDKETYNLVRPYTSNRVIVWPSNPQWDDSLYNKIHPEAWKSFNDEERIFLNEQIHKPIFRFLTGINDDSPEFYIWDGKTADSHPSEVYEKIKVFSTDSTETVSDKAQFAYRTHHSTESEFSKYWNKRTSDYSAIEAIDGITGDNSSDRLVRREPLNEKWYYSHLSALQKRVAVFDERLFRIVHNVNEADFVTDFTPGVNLILRDLETNKINETCAINLLAKTTLNMDVIESLYGKSRNEIIELVRPYVKSVFNSQEKDGNHISGYYREKGVDIYTILKDENGDFAVVGLTSFKNENANKPYHAHFDRIATISHEDGRITINEEYRNLFDDSHRYDFISIHQGILDKVYTGMGIKRHNEHNDKSKCGVTKELFMSFMKNKTTVPLYNAPGDYLPRFIIHSGRSKPTVEDMPQPQPFIQYAAIEHAVKDCKFSLIELLEFARYEPSKQEIENYLEYLNPANKQ